MKNIKQIIKEELNEDKFISLKIFKDRLCEEQKKDTLSSYNEILNNSDLNWFLLKTNKYKNVNISYSDLENYIKWNNGLWYNGIWKDGYWNNGIWYNGIWNYGTWQSGIWNYGEWIDGYWDSGYWLGGKWNKGEIYDKNLFKSVIITLNPAEYYKRNNIKQ